MHCRGASTLQRALHGLEELGDVLAHVFLGGSLEGDLSRHCSRGSGNSGVSMVEIVVVVVVLVVVVVQP